MPKLRLACNVSGGGRTVLNFLDEIDTGRLDAEVVLVVADRECKAIERCAARGVTVELVPWARGSTPQEWAERVWPRVMEARVDLVCNAGFLRFLVIPPEWENRVLNIHPALLPKYGGKGMYGDYVHAAVLDANEMESGCTVHFVTNEYDTGPVVLQKRVPVQPDDTVDSLAARVFQAECDAYPEAVRLYGADRLSVVDGIVEISDE
jgi:phosphoribosylglycinamide formyltransferase-1